MKHTLALLLLVAVPCPLRADDPKPGVDAATAFKALQGLVGRWKLDNAPPDGGDGTIAYRLTGAGSVLVEEMFPGSNHEMLTVYHRDGNDLVLTHYCAVGNQPRMRLDRKASTPTRLVFSFDGGTNLDPAKDGHMHECVLDLADPARPHAAWTYYQQGKPAGNQEFSLHRTTP